MTEARPATQDADDARLLNLIRAGDAAAFSVLIQRHGEAARRLAGQLAWTPGDADDLVTETFALVLAITRRGGGPSDAFRPYMLTAVRRVHANRLRYRQNLPPGDRLLLDPGALFIDSDLPGGASLADERLVRGYLSLPERWSAVLWHTEIERAAISKVTPVFGLTRSGIAALQRRAKAGLRQACLQSYLAQLPGPQCKPAVDRLGPFIRDSLSVRETSKVSAHLADCADCSAVCAELADVSTALRAKVAPVILGAGAAAYLAGAAEAAAGATAERAAAAAEPAAGAVIAGPVELAAIAPAAVADTGTGATGTTTTSTTATSTTATSTTATSTTATSTTATSTTATSTAPTSTAPTSTAPTSTAPTSTAGTGAAPTGTAATAAAATEAAATEAAGTDAAGGTADRAGAVAAAGAAGAAGITAIADPAAAAAAGGPAGPGAGGPDVTSRGHWPARRSRWLSAAAAALLVVAAVAVAVALTGHGSATRPDAQRRSLPVSVSSPSISASAPPPSPRASRKPAAEPSPSKSAVATAVTPAPPASTAASVQLTASIGVTGPGHHRWGYLASFTVSDTGSAGTGELTVSITLPSGSQVPGGGGGHWHRGRGPAGGWSCQPSGNGATCQHAAIAAGGQVPGMLFFTVSGSGGCGQPAQITATSGAASASAQSQGIQC